MKKFGKIASVLAIVALVLVAFTSCDPTFGLNTVTFTDIANASLTGTYSLTTTSYTRDDNGKVKSKDSNTTTQISASTVKISCAAYALLAGDEAVYANSDFSKIVVYNYTENAKGIRTSETCYAYTKEK